MLSTLDHDDLRSALEAAGWRCTTQRLAVYDHLSCAEHHPTAEEVYQGVRLIIPKISLATVYKARQLRLNRLVALKLLHAGQLATVADKQRFQVEAEATANLDHPHIVRIFEVDEDQGQTFLSMALIEGPWKDPLSGFPISPPIEDAANFPVFLEGTRLHLFVLVAGVIVT